MKETRGKKSHIVLHPNSTTIAIIDICREFSGFLKNISILYIPRERAIKFLCAVSVQFSCSVVFNSFQPHESQHTRPPCPSPSPEFTQTHVHRVSDAIQPAHPLSSSSPPAPKSLSSYEVAKVLEFQL